MPIVPLRPLLEATDKYGFAHGAFNVNAVHQAKAVIEVHEMFRSAAILQGADLANGFMGGRTDFANATIEDKKRGAARIAAAVKKYGENSPVPVVLHLDHGRDFASVKAAIDNGYTSVMIDGSHLPFAANVELTREVVKYAHPKGITVEGELGILAGVEDQVHAESSTYTNPVKACEFFRKTCVDCLAISYGTKHGAAKGANAGLRAEIAVAVAENMKHEGIFGVLVSHGSSTVPAYIVEEINEMGGKIGEANGIPIGQLQAVIPYGVGKINVDTDIRLAVTRNIREYFATNPAKRNTPVIGEIWRLMEEKAAQFDPRVYLTPIMNTLITGEIPNEEVAAVVACLERGVKEVVGTLIVRFGSVGYAPKIEPVTLEQMADRYRRMDL